MGTTQYPSADTPITIPLCDVASSTIEVTDEDVISNLSVDVNITAVDEGGGPDNSLMVVILNATLSVIDVTLHDGTSDSLSGVNFDNDRSPASGSMDDFDGETSLDDWRLDALDFYSGCSGSDGSLNSWTLNISVADIVPMPPQFPGAPAARTIPTGIEYNFKRNGGLLKNSKLFFPFAGTSAQNILDNARLVPFNASMAGIKISAINTGSAGTTQVSLHKVSNGVDTVVFNKRLILPFGKTNSYSAFGETFNRAIDKDDLVYFSLDTVATGLQDVTVELVLSLRD